MSDVPLYGSINSKSKSRIRVAKACDRCKQKKTKCDGLNPCLSCVKHKLPCIYTPSVFIKTSGTDNSMIKDEEPEPASISGPAISATSLSAAVEAANEAPTMAEKRKEIIGVNNSAIMARLRDRIIVLENDITRLAHHIRSGTRGSNASSTFDYKNDFMMPGLGSFLEGDQKASQVDPHANLKSGGPKLLEPGIKHVNRRGPPLNKSSDYGESENPCENIDYTDFKTGNFKYQKGNMRYARRYASYLPYRMGLALTEDMTPEMKSKVNVPRIQYYGWNMSGVHYLKPRTIPAPIILLQEKTARSLLNYFFQNVNPLFSILHKPMFMEQYDAYLLRPDKKECRLFMAIFHVVCAISIRYREICDRQVFEPGLEEKLFDDGFSTLQAFSFEWESLEIIQGNLLMTLYLRACHRQPSAWGVLGTAIRMSLGMGLMHKIQLSSHPSDYDILKHERVFWACFVMDRTLCMECGRHFSFREDDISVAFPHYYIDDGWQTPISSALLRFCLTLGDLVYDRDLDLNTDDLHSMKARLLAWNDGMKDFELNSDVDLDRFKLPAALVGHFRLQYYNTLFFIHMRSVYGLVGPKWDSSLVDRKLYMNCIHGVINITATLSKLGQLTTPWWLTLSNLYYAGCVALLLLYNQISVTEMGQALSKIIGLISEISEDGRFIMAKECLWSLKTLNHMVFMKLSRAQELLQKVGLDHGPASINKGNFSSMGVLDHEGKEVLAIVMEKKEDESEQQQHQQQQQSSGAQTESSPFVTPGMDKAIFENISPLQVISPYQDSEPAMSLAWFENWDWETEPSMSNFFPPPLETEMSPNLQQ